MAVYDKTYYCEKCKRTMAGDQFYSSHNLEKYPNDGKLNQCKKCLTMHVDNFDPDSYIWILQECDVPYVPAEWHGLLQTYGRDKSKLTGASILGRYLSKMRLKQWRDYRWKDTAFLQEVENAKIEQAMKAQGYDAAEIAMTLNEKNSAIPEGDVEIPVYKDEPANEAPVYDDYFSQQAPEINIDLTDEDRTYLCLKWGKTYKPEEWVKLEQLYEDMMSSYDIQTAGHIDTLKLICKTSLKANQLIDIGDVEGFQKMSKVYDGLMKSGKFTAAQNKAESGEYVDSISELVAICEKDGFIPRYYTDGPQDKVDRTLQDLQSYTRTLVTEEMNLGNLIEQAVKQIELDKIKEAEDAADAADDDEIMENSLFSDDSTNYISDGDYSDFKNLEEEFEENDEEYLNKLLLGEVR